MKNNKSLDELIKAFEIAAKARDWSWKVQSIDELNFRYATVHASRGEVDATFEFTCDEQIKLSCHNTSFHSYGMSDLRDAAWNEIKKLSWVEKNRKPNEEISTTASNTIENFFRKFHRVARQLKHRHDDRASFEISDEYDVQDLTHAILRGMFDDIRAEEYSPSYAGGASRLDFLLKKEKIVVEIKFASNRLKDKNIGEQLIVDIERYRVHPDCKTLICFVYDPMNNLKNPMGLESDLSKVQNGFAVRVIVVSPS